MTNRLRTRALAGLMASLLVLLAACGGGGDSAGGGGGASGGDGAPAPSGAVASKMVPQMNGWAFPNFPSSSFPDVNFDTADLVSMFGSGPDVCVDGVAEPCTLTAEAAAWARMVNQARATGHCEGLVALASARFNAAQLPETVKLPSEKDEVHAIMRTFATQFVPEVQKAIEDWTKASLAEKVDELKRSFGKDKLEYTLGVYTEGGGHAILPYAVEYPTPDVARIMVYDSNWPGRNRYVDVDLKAEKWTFSFSGQDPANDPQAWTGGAQDMDLTPFEARQGSCPFCSDGTKLESTTLLVRTTDLNWSVETEQGAVSPTSPTSADGAAARPVKGGVVITRLAPRLSDRSSYDYVITIPNKLLEDGSASSTTMGPTTVAPGSTTVTKKRRARLRFPGASSVFAVMKTGVAQFTTPGGTSDNDAVEIGTTSIKSNSPKVDLTLAAGNLVANASGSSVELGSTSDGSLAVAVTTATGQVIQQQVTPDAPAVQVKADESGAVTVLQATSTGEVQKTEVAADGTKTQTTVDASALNLNKVEVELPPALASKPIESLPKLEDRNLNNPNYKADEAYVPPTTVPSAAAAKESATGATTTVPSKSETASTMQTKNAALPTTTVDKGDTPTTLQTKNAALPTTTAPKSVSAAGVTPTTVAAVVKPTLTNFRIASKTFGDDPFTVDPPDSNSPGGFRYTSSKTDVATVSLTTGRITIVGAGSTVITATQSAAKGFEAATVSATLLVAKATPTNVPLKDVAKTFGDDPFVIAKPTSDSTGAFTFTSSDETVVKQSKTTGRWVVMGAGKATITATQAATDDFTTATDSLLVTVKKGTPEVTAPADVAKTYLDADFDLPRPTSDSRGALTFTSSDPNVVTVTSTGRATIKSGGSATITVSQASTDDWVAASTSYKVTVGLAAPTLSAFDDVTKTFGDDAFTLTSPKSNSTGAITYKSSDEKVATVGANDGKVTVIGAGSATITASQGATSSFAAGTISSKITVAKATPKLSDLLILDKSYGDPDFTLKPTSNSAGKITYSTDKPAIFNVDPDTGLVKIVGVGTATLTAKQATTANYEAASVSASVTVKKGTPTITWTLDNKTFGDPAFDLVAPTSPSMGAFTYSISSADQTKATVTANRVTILGAGTVTVTASQAATDFYVAATKTATLTIDKAAPTLTGFTIPAKTFGDQPFTLTPPTSSSSGAFTYEIVEGSMSNPSVATLNAQTGVVVIGAAGSVQIRAKQEFTSNYTVASAVATLTVNRATQAAGISNGLVAKWSFDSANTLGVNSAGTGDLIQTGGPTWSASGKTGGALSLNGSAYLNLAQGASIAGLPIGNSTYTQTAWFNASALGGRGIIGWGSYGAGNQVNALRLFGTGGGFRHYWWGNDLDSGVTLQTGQWYHVAATFDGTTRRIYLNGQVVASDQPTGHNATANAFAVGATNNFSERFMGLLDDVAIYNRALSANEITQLAAGGSSGISVTSTSGNFGTPISLTTSGGQGTGAVTFELVAAGTAGCTLTGSTLAATSGGTCTVKATKAGDTNYEPSVSPDAVVTFNRIAQASAVTVTSTSATAGINLALTASGGSGTGSYSFTVTNAGTTGCSIQNGSLVTTGSGTCSVTATKAADANYTSSTSSATAITVVKQAPTIAPFTLVDRYYLGAGFTITAPGSTSNGTWTWASSNTSVASINSSTGAVTLGVPGTVIITATQASTAMYASAAVTAELKVLPATPTYGAFTIASKTYGDAPFTFTAPTSNSPASFTYTSSDANVATVNSATRTVTIVGIGSATITASQAPTSNFAAGSTTATFVVNGVTPSLTTFGADSGSGAGLKGTRYVGYFNDNVNWFASATKQGETNQITNFTNFSSNNDYYSWEWTGSFKASTTGTYTFCTNSDDASYLWLGPSAKAGFTQGNALVDNRGLHGMSERCNTTSLVGGTYYPIRIQFGENAGGDAIIVRFIPPGGTSIYNGVGYYFGGMGLTKAEGAAPFTPTLPTSNSPAPFTYSSSNTAVATIDATTGEVTVVGRGTTTLTATQAATGTWASASTTVELRVLRRANVGSFNLPTGLTFASAPFTPTPPTSDSPGSWSYESSNSAVAAWDSATGKISLAAAGTATITAVQAETGEYAESRVSTTLTIAGETVVGIDSGERHSCAVTQAGGVVCWGYNNYGQLGDGTNTNRAYPVAVSGITSGAIKVVTSLWHSCALMSNGTMKCWGRGDWGELGNNAYSTSYAPVTVSGITDATDIGITSYTSCAVVSLGALKCWGFNGNGWGLVGNNSDANTPTPISVPNLNSGVTSVAGGEGTMCATVDTGALKCWGRNEWGNLGDGTNIHRKVPTDVIGLPSGATSVSPGQYSTCAVAGAGGVYCWGYNDYGMLGNGNNNQYWVPVQVTGLTSGWKSVVMGERNACAVSQTGSLRCWGRNDWGNLGNGTTSWSNVPVTPTGLDSGVRQVSVGWYFMCALLTTGSVKCTGYNGEYELGDKTTTQRTTVVPVAGLQTPIITDPDTQLSGVSLSVTNIRRETPPFTFAAATSNRPNEVTYSSTNTSVATVDATTRTITIVGVGTAYVKASVAANQTQSAAVTYTKISVPDTEFVQISDNYYHTCGVTRSGGVKCWGNGDWGQLGNGTTERRFAPADVFGLTSGVTSVATGHHHTCALTTVGTVECWGLNDNGQLGIGSTTRLYAPGQVKGLTGIIQVAAGYQHTCALSAAGAVKCWGLNSYGELGDGTTDNRTLPVDVVGLGSRVVQISAGHEFTCAVLETGAVKCWGYNGYGQVGDGSNVNRLVPRSVSGLGSGVKQVSAGFHHSCALTTGGAVKCWGYNGYGQLGDGTTSDRYTPVAVSGLSSGVTRVENGGYHTCAVTTAGGLKCWGRNDNGELGDGTTSRRYVPVDVAGMASGVVDLGVTRGYTTCAIVENDAPKCWGMNDWGQIGNFSSTSVSVPNVVAGSFAGAARASTTLGALSLPGSGYTTTSSGFTLAAPTSSRSVGNLSCAAGGLCHIGDTGPGGGRVFYVSNGFAAPGTPCNNSCTYLEAAPNTWYGSGNDPLFPYSGNTNTAIGDAARGTAIGTGYGNTLAIIAQSGVASRSATASRAYTGGGKSDWYLPSLDEMRALYFASSASSVAPLVCDWYSTSTERDANYHFLWHGCADLNTYAGKWDNRWTRPIRAFSPTNVDAPLTFMSSDTAVATIDQWTGAVTIVGAGSTTLAAVQGGTGDTKLGVSRVTLNVAPATGSACEQGIACSIGDTGPGGGKIFFVDTNDDVIGVDYMEIAPTDVTDNWCNTAAASTALGSTNDDAVGINNMQAILGACTSGAAVGARSATIGGKSDWYLPAPGELALARANLVQAGLGNGLSGDYWTSRQYDATRAFTYDPATGMQVYATKTDTRAYRPIRSFAARSATPINANLTGFAVPSGSYPFGTAPFATTAPASLNPGLTVYSSSDTNVATINQYSGQVTIVGAGSVTFTATKPAYGSFVAKSLTAGFTVTKGTPTLSNFTAPGGPYRADDADFTMSTPTVNTTDAGAISYSSANTSIATINSTSGLVHLVAAGVAVLTASVPGSANWNPASITYTLNVGALCKDGGSCRIGDVGPGGGTVFLVDSNNIYPTVDFMEIAPADATNAGVSLCSAAVTLPNTGSAIGTGADNTATLIAAALAAAAATTTTSTTSTSTPSAPAQVVTVSPTCDAASAADAYVNASQTDWHLPSKAEIQLAMSTLAAKNIVLPSGSYWTSSSGSAGGVSGVYMIDEAGATSIADPTSAAKVRPVRAWQRRESCKDIKESTGTNADGVYTINVNNAGTIVPTQAYCLMNSAMAGGGWTLVWKAAQGSTTFPYSSNYWTTANTLNESSLDLSATDAKFSTFNRLQGTQLLAIFPDVNINAYGATERGSIDGQNYGWTWKTAIPGGPKTALSIFQGGDEQFVQDAVTFDGYNGSIWSSQADIRFYGFNWNDNRKARWGFGWNENGGGLWPNGYKGSDDTSGGLGLADNNWSAGDVLGCCQNSNGVNRSMAAQMFIR